MKHYKVPGKRDKSLVLTVRQVMEYLDLSMPSVYAALYRGDFPAEKVGGIWLIKKVPFFDRFGWPNGRRPKNIAASRMLIEDPGAEKIAPRPLPDGMAHAIVTTSRPTAHERGMPKFKDDPRWWTAARAAEELGCGVRYVRDVLCAESLIRYEKFGKIYRIIPESVIEYRRSITHGPGQPPE